MKPDHISISQINQYLMCGRKYAYRYVYGYDAEFKPVALAFGISIHAALAWFNEQLMKGRQPAPDMLFQIFDADWEASLHDSVRFQNAGQAARLREQAQVLLGAYAEQMADLEPAAVEARFEVPITNPETGEVLSDVPLVGVVDCIDTQGTLYEFKTAARAFDELSARKQLQLTAYSYARRMLDDPPKALAIVGLLKQKRPRLQMVYTERVLHDECWFVRLAVDVIEAIDAMVFPPNPTQTWLCNGCDYKKRCSKELPCPF